MKVMKEMSAKWMGKKEQRKGTREWSEGNELSK
jgi:hypothetical protein